MIVSPIVEALTGKAPREEWSLRRGRQPPRPSVPGCARRRMGPDRNRGRPPEKGKPLRRSGRGGAELAPRSRARRRGRRATPMAAARTPPRRRRTAHRGTVHRHRKGAAGTSSLGHWTRRSKGHLRRGGAFNDRRPAEGTSEAPTSEVDADAARRRSREPCSKPRHRRRVPRPRASPRPPRAPRRAMQDPVRTRPAGAKGSATPLNGGRGRAPPGPLRAGTGPAKGDRAITTSRAAGRHRRPPRIRPVRHRSEFRHVSAARTPEQAVAAGAGDSTGATGPPHAPRALSRSSRASSRVRPSRARRAQPRASSPPHSSPARPPRRGTAAGRRRGPDAGHDRSDSRLDRARRPPGSQLGSHLSRAGRARLDQDSPEPDRRRAHGTRHRRHAAAAQALQAGRGELHQSLSSLGISLLRLDIGSFSLRGDGRTSERRHAGIRRRAQPNDDGQDSIDAVDGAGDGRASRTKGELVDVLA